MENLIRRIFTWGFRKCTARRTDSSSGASQEYLLSDQSVEEKDYEYLSGDDSEPYTSLPHLADDLVLRISSLLDEVSLLCLKNTNAHFRNIIKMNEKQLPRCVKWRMLTLLERDLQDKGDSLPNTLACIYCKRTHPRADFGVRNGNAGYGIERLYVMEACGPGVRFCWRYIPKLLDYTARIENPEVDNRDLPYSARSTDKWVSAYRATCCHCCGRLDHDQNGKLSCPTCKKKCEACGFTMLLHYERHGPQRPLESYANIRFVRNLGTGYSLEIRDLNGIRHPDEPPPKEPKIWRERCLLSEIHQDIRAAMCLLHDPVERNLFSLYSPVVFSSQKSQRRSIPPNRG